MNRPELPLLLALLTPLPATAAFHLWEVVEVYSNADGSVQFIEFFTNVNNQDELENHDVDTDTSTPYVFPQDLGASGPGGAGNNATANERFLVATPDFSCSGVSGPVLPDYVLPAGQFFDVDGDTIDFSAGADIFSYVSGELPTDGASSLNEPFGGGARTTATNSPTNFAGETCTLPEPGGLASLAAGVALLLGLRRGA